MSDAGPEVVAAGNPESRIQNPKSPVVLFKLGGSLLTLPDLGARVQAVLQMRPQCRPMMVVGGGAAADVVREWDRLHRLGDELAHQLAIKAMTGTAFLAVALLERAQVVTNLGELDSVWQADGLPILLVEPVLAALEARNGDRLPRSWDVTSDSIAAWLSLQTGVDELVLLKSVDFPAVGLDTARFEGSIDRYFAALLHALPRVTWVNLRCTTLQFVDCATPLGASRMVDVQPA